MESIMYVRSVVTDGSGHSIVDADCMPDDELTNILWSLHGLYNDRVTVGRVGDWERWTFTARLSDGRRVSDMIYASRIR